MTVVLQTMWFSEKPTTATIASCGFVTWGFTYAFIPAPFIGGATTSIPTQGATGVGREAPMLGMVFGVLSAAMVAIHAVLVKAAMRAVDGRTMDLAYWQNALSAMVLIPGILVSGEVGGLMRLISGADEGLRAFAIGSGVTVCLSLRSVPGDSLG